MADQLYFNDATRTTSGNAWRPWEQALRADGGVKPTALGGKRDGVWSPLFGLASNRVVLMTSWDSPGSGIGTLGAFVLDVNHLATCNPYIMFTSVSSIKGLALNHHRYATGIGLIAANRETRLQVQDDHGVVRGLGVGFDESVAIGAHSCWWIISFRAKPWRRASGWTPPNQL